MPYHIMTRNIYIIIFAYDHDKYVIITRRY